MTKTDRRYRCSGCHAPLGRRDGDTLAVDGLRVVLTLLGATISCAACHTEKTWRPQTGPRATGARRATIHIGVA